MAKRKAPRPEPEKLIARIESFEQTYYIGQLGKGAEDEALIDIVARIERVSPRHKQHLGELIDIRLACARSFNGDGPTAASDKPFLMFMNLSKNHRSLMAYLPSSPFWSIPQMIEAGRVTHIDVRFAPLHRGSGDLESVYLIPESKLDEVWAI
jgi:hypothetical protein